MIDHVCIILKDYAIVADSFHFYIDPDIRIEIERSNLAKKVITS